MPAYLIVLDGGGSRHEVSGRAVVGRDADCDVLLSSLSASRKHAAVEQTASGWLLKDLASVNGTFVNGKRVTETLLSHGDALRFGEVKAVFEISDRKSVSGTGNLLQTLSLPPTRKARPVAAVVATFAGIFLLVAATIWAKRCDRKAAAPPPPAAAPR
jgi:pSer/pThr/pTyr-binding forkhead associated (FHA) protein